MTPPQFNQIQTTLWKNRIPGIVEFNVLLNQLPEASLIYDRERDAIILANSQLLQLTAFTQDELSGNSIRFLIQDANRQLFIAGEEKYLSLNLHNRNPIPMVVRTTVIESDSQWLLLTIIPANLHYKNQLKRQEKILQGYLSLARLTEFPDLISSVENALQIAQSLLETNLICIYRMDGNNFPLKKIESIEPNNIFPDLIPFSELSNLDKLTVWIPGRRVVTEIHRAGRVENLSYVVSIPLGQEVSPYGLLVVGDKVNRLDNQQDRMIELLGKYISGALRHYELVDALRHDSKLQTYQLTIKNALVENSQEGILVLSPGLIIDYINPWAELMLGYACNEVCNKPAENILIGPEGLVPALEAACRGIETRDLGNVYLHRRDGHSFPAHIRTISVQNNEELLAIIVFVTDQSEHEQIRIQTQQLEHRAILGDFTAVFAHEVRNPINNIVTGLQLLASKLSADDANQDLISRMQGDCLRLNHLMESVLSFSRPMEPKFEVMDISVLLQRIIDRWRPRLARVNVISFFQAADDVPMISGDPRLLEQVFTNLIGNAVEAMNITGGTLGIHITISDTITNRPHVRVTVSDNGPGIPDEIKDRVFEPFVSNNPRGTGLGLAITKRILTAHHGSVSLDTFPGGTMFHVYLPVGNGEKAWD